MHEKKREMRAAKTKWNENHGKSDAFFRFKLLSLNLFISNSRAAYAICIATGLEALMAQTHLRHRKSYSAKKNVKQRTSPGPTKKHTPCSMHENYVPVNATKTHLHMSFRLARGNEHSFVCAATRQSASHHFLLSNSHSLLILIFLAKRSERAIGSNIVNCGFWVATCNA